MEKEYLEATKCCDVEHPEIKKTAISLVSNCKTDKEKAISIFNFVRDRIKYRFDYSFKKASETLIKKEGNCFNKANLQIALLRSIKIPAGYEVFLITKKVFLPIVSDEIYQMINEPTIHVCCCCFLNGNWISSDATIDKELFEAVYRKVENWEYKEWNGVEKILLNKKYIKEEQGIYPNIDLYLLNPPRFWNDQLIEKANEYIEKLINESSS